MIGVRWRYGVDSFRRRLREDLNVCAVECTQALFGHGSVIFTAISWNVCTGERTQTFIGHVESIRFALVSEDGGTVWTGSKNR